MLISDIPALKEFWYPVAYSAEVADKPIQRRLFGQDLVVWRSGPERAVHAALDYCPHRGARLSQGWIDDDCLTCPYHGWRFDGDGQCVQIPQNPEGSPIPRRAKVHALHAGERYELIWVCVADEPREPIPVLSDLEDPSFVLVHELMEEWNVTAMRCVDNALDVSHLSFVHRNSVGDSSQPRLTDYTVTRDGYHIHFSTSYTAQVTDEMRRATGLTGDTTTRTTHAELVQPLVFRGLLEYENGLKHVLYKTATPVDDDRTLFCQFIARNDNPDEEKRQGIIGIDRVIQSEDKALLEGLLSNFPLEVTTEIHTKADRMTVEYRKVLAELAAEADLVTSDDSWNPLAAVARTPVHSS